ncbi:hypothetical protein RRG08_059085 [Elysia crispata]|uniref:Uncharacterized protein n=1 Tax=Elysia crispata TaxID=231223 RepID=A0AAE1B843_9GAST|nr:hypothetical protein RRG08_059085 [Elysia crispata]
MQIVLFYGYGEFTSENKLFRITSPETFPALRESKRSRADRKDVISSKSLLVSVKPREKSRTALGAEGESRIVKYLRISSPLELKILTVKIFGIAKESRPGCNRNVHSYAIQCLNHRKPIC